MHRHIALLCLTLAMPGLVVAGLVGGNVATPVFAALSVVAIVAMVFVGAAQRLTGEGREALERLISTSRASLVPAAVAHIGRAC